MSEHEHHSGPGENSDGTVSEGSSSDGPSLDGSSGRRTARHLPPPAFPPGKRRIHVRRSLENRDGELQDGYISPDAPIPERGPGMDAAFISPDDPIPDRGGLPADAIIAPDEAMPGRGEASRAVAAAAGALDAEEGVVMGMGLDPHLDPEELAKAVDPHVMELVVMVGKLAEKLDRKGEAGLRSLPGMSRFEATLRAYCVGYLAGRRAEDEPEPDF